MFTLDILYIHHSLSFAIRTVKKWKRVSTLNNRPVDRIIACKVTRLCETGHWILVQSGLHCSWQFVLKSTDARHTYGWPNLFYAWSLVHSCSCNPDNLYYRTPYQSKCEYYNLLNIKYWWVVKRNELFWLRILYYEEQRLILRNPIVSVKVY